MKRKMKTIFFSILIMLMLFMNGVLKAQTLDLKMMSFNMQQPYGTNWDGRKANAAQIINTYQGDIIGTQELVNYQRDYVMANCPGYTVFGQGRDCGDAGEGSWVIFKTSKFTLDAGNSGNFWFSDNPNVCGRGWDPNYNRICTYVRLIDKATGKAFYVFNSHFPTPDQPTARTKSAQLLCARAASRTFPNDPVIFTGDFNSIETESQINYIKSDPANPSKMRDSYRDLYPTGTVTTGFGVKFDFIFIENKNNVAALASAVVTSPSASDHMPITATIRLGGTVVPVAIPVPGKVEAESFSSMNGIQTETTTDAGGGYDVGWIDANDWMDYSINVANSGNYDVTFRSAGTSAGAIKMLVDGIDVTGSVSLPVTGEWQTWASTTKSTVALTAGNHTMRLYAVTSGFNLNYVTVSVPSVPQSPFNNIIASLPGKLEAENYDLGGQAVAYNDATAANEGGAFRNDGVDLEACADAGAGYNVGYTADGEWLEYTVNVANSGAYDVAFRTASTSGGVIRMEIDNVDVTGNIVLPNTVGWQSWATTTKANVSLTVGQHILKLFIVTGGFNLNYVNVSTPVVISGPGFLHASGKNIVNNQGNFQIKAANIGNYMLQEGYMLNLGGGYQHIIKQKITDVVGAANADKFYDDYHTNYLTKADIDSLAKWGFNSIRLPMHYNLFTPLGQPDVFLEKGFAMVDQIVSWCKANNMYVILDLHAAPGGQSSGDISDYIAGQPSLWESAANRDQTVKLWRKFAERYANEQYVGGYDLINETNWTIAGNTLLANLMKDITSAIRQVDNNHILFIEGNSYANDYTGLTPKWDNNMAYSFHKYWNDVNDGSISFVLAIRDGQNVPIWLGEFGENSNHWIAETVTLMNKHNIGWAVWPYKKMSSISGIGSFKEPNNWSVMSGYINGGAKPSAATAQAILDELVENVKLTNITINYGYIYALIQAPNNTTKEYAPVSLPGKVYAAKYDEGKNGFAYNDLVYQTAQYGGAGGDFTAWNNGYYLRNDGVDLQFSTAENTATVGWTETNEWMQYTVNVSATSAYSVKLRVAGNGGKVSLSSDGVILLNSVTLPSTGGWDTWQTISLGNVNLTAGKHTLRLTINTAGFNISYLDFAAVANQSPVVSITSPVNMASFNAPASITINANAADADGTVSNVNFYNGATLIGSDNTAPYSFTWNNVAADSYNLTVKAIDNLGAETTSAIVNVTVVAVTSITIQAEAYSSMLGVLTENTLDADGVLDVGWIDAGDWMAYGNVNFPSTGNYTVEYRVASLNGGKLSCDLNAGAMQLGAVNIPATGGWQTWTTITQTINVNAGTYSFGIFAPIGGWNINWFRITKQTTVLKNTQLASSSDNVMETSFEFYPNPAIAELYIKSSADLSGGQAKVFDGLGSEVISVIVEKDVIDVTSLKAGIYTLVVYKYGNKVSRRFVKQ